MVARIDMRELLRDDARFSRGIKVIDLCDWLGHGIDPWVWATVRVLKTLLLAGTHQTSTVTGYGAFMRYFFLYLTQNKITPHVETPEKLSPLHIGEFCGWVSKQAQMHGWAKDTPRKTFSTVKAVLMEMFAQGLIPGDPKRYFFRGMLPWEFTSRQTALSDAEQERLAQALKKDLIEAHHGRRVLSPRDTQAVRLLLIAIRQGLNPTPLLEIPRDALEPGVLPGTVRIRTQKFRNRKLRSGVGRDVSTPLAQDMAFALSEGAVLYRAIEETDALVREAPTQYRQRIWLYRSQNPRYRDLVTCLTRETLHLAINDLVDRHDLQGDDGERLKLNLSRLRKAYFERAFRHADGDLVVTANLMGNTPYVAGSNYAVMNAQRQMEAAEFMNGEFTALMRGEKDKSQRPNVIPIEPYQGGVGNQVSSTPVASCRDTRMGENAPRDGQNHCNRYVMCLFCTSFAVVGEVDELWRLFSFQVFAREELEHLDAALGAERTADIVLEDLRDRYRLAIPYIDDFTKRQFAASRVQVARSKTAAALHPYWMHQIHVSRKARGVDRQGTKNGT